MSKCKVCGAVYAPYREHQRACTACNQGVGCFKDDPQRLIAAAAYLTNHQMLKECHE